MCLTLHIIIILNLFTKRDCIVSIEKNNHAETYSCIIENVDFDQKDQVNS